MKSILMSIKPKWVELIVLGRKTVEIRPTRPMKIEPPFKVFMYCTKDKNHNYSGRIVGEFECSEITIIESVDGSYSYLKSDECNKYDYAIYRNMLLEQACLETDKFIEYAGKHKRMYAWRINNLHIYDRPVEVIGTPPQSWFFYDPEKSWKSYQKRIKEGGEE